MGYLKSFFYYKTVYLGNVKLITLPDLCTCLFWDYPTTFIDKPIKKKLGALLATRQTHLRHISKYSLHLDAMFFFSLLSCTVESFLKIQDELLVLAILHFQDFFNVIFLIKIC